MALANQDYYTIQKKLGYCCDIQKFMITKLNITKIMTDITNQDILEF